MLPQKIVSGGQTGVDRGALDAALECGVACGGFVPKGRRAEDGPIPSRYPVEECASQEYVVRTELNVVHSDATLILNRGGLEGGTLATVEFCRRHNKPYSVLQLDRVSAEQAAASIRHFFFHARPKVLNVAGPRESKCPGIQQAAREAMRLALRAVPPAAPPLGA